MIPFIVAPQFKPQANNIHDILPLTTRWWCYTAYDLLLSLHKGALRLGDVQYSNYCSVQVIQNNFTAEIQGHSSSLCPYSEF